MHEEEVVPEPSDDAFTARITLRLPESLKLRIEAAATRDGDVCQHVARPGALALVVPRRPSGRSRHRLTGYGRS